MSKRQRSRRSGTRRSAGLAAVVLVAALTGAGCKATGGGSIPSETGAKKATFGFVWQETKESEKFVVRGTWSDGYVKFKITDGIVFSFFNDCATGLGSYTSTNKAYAGTGSLSLTVCDEGEPGPTEGNSISVNPLTGPYSSYSNAGDLEGGNLQVS